MLDKLKFDKYGLIPAVVQDFYTKEVLTVAYMNRESLEITLKEKKTCFFSRSRQQLWRKGETSGNYQHVVSIAADCDCDALTVQVIKDGPACHLGTESCFRNVLYADETAGKIKEEAASSGNVETTSFGISDLYALIADRKANPKAGSYTNYLFEKGREKILKKVGEECTETVIGAMKDSREETIFEISDLTYHVLVLMIEMGISVGDILAQLESRHVVDKKVKQEALQ